MAGGRTQRLVRLAGGFLPGLNTEDPPYKLKEDESPDAYGISLSYDGEIVPGTCPTGTARVQTVVTVSETPVAGGGGAASIPYYWHYSRLWNITNRTASTASGVLTYGAKFYRHRYYAQGIGRETFDEGTGAILVLLPVEPDSLFVGKASGGYLLSNCNDGRAFFQRTDLMQELALPAANQSVEVDGSVFVANANGVTVLEGGKTAELSRKIRGETLTGLAVTADYAKRRVIVGTTHVYDIGLERWFKYDSDNFRYTTRQLAAPDFSPFAVDRALFVIRHTTANDGVLTYQTRYEDEAWSDDLTVNIPVANDNYTIKSETLAQRRAVRRFQMRVTGLTDLALREIVVESDVKQLDDYST
jgi:hypothetical protein